MTKDQLLPDEIIANKIYYIRGQKVMLDRDLAELYGVETKRLKEQVKRNANRFPERFMFELTKDENDALRSHFATLKQGEHSKYLPFVFTEHGILMLANVLKSETAVEVSIRIIDIFVKLRETFADQTEIWLQIERLKGKLDNQDKNMEIVFRYLDELSERIQKPPEVVPRKRIGYKSDDL
ncbi:ORF6N domain-containing protein [Mucilaginibacter ginsenosidivorans]|uniref:ORF6N domain-containing protein n=1 Tax=Mucilaginibacter ginsenosidivorans TaxID=398053 RepID=A0A5B8UTM4_9SPHI|nr:ORF6N domain-containing protein [Mucilaginibacter ginsenosidivorans]QEC62460.1 ORF6N domain-containing protein [Mucilaginibacter ginsenosidivorans]